MSDTPLPHSDSAHERSHAPDTPGSGRTSNATSLAAAIQAANRPGIPAPPAAARAPLAADTHHTARVFPKWLTRGAPTLLLLAVTLVSLVKLAEYSRDGAQPAAPASSLVAGADPLPSPQTPPQSIAPTGPEAPPSALPSELSRGMSVRNLLELELEQVRPPHPPSFLKLGRALTKNGPRVTVLNAWATWCEPCKQELPALQDMFVKNGAAWADRVRFISVLSQDTIDPTEAFRRFGAAMPTTDAFLAEVRANALAEALRSDRAITGEGLPIWVLLDCHRERRFAHVGALQPHDFAELERKIDQLESELDTPFCDERRPTKPKTPRPSAPEAAPLQPADPPQSADPPQPADPPRPQPTAPTPHTKHPTCGDGVCQPAEDCHHCPADCSCAVGTCQARPDGTHHCHRGLM